MNQLNETVVEQPPSTSVEVLDQPAFAMDRERAVYVTNLMMTLRQLDPTLRLRFALRDEAGKDALIDYVLFERAGGSDLLTKHFLRVFGQAFKKGSDPNGSWPVTLLQTRLHGYRGDVCARYDLSMPANRVGFLYWFYTFGVVEHRLYDFVHAGDIAFLRSSVSDLEPSIDRRITKFMYLVWRGRDDIGSSVDITTAEGADAYIHWFLVHGVLETGANRWPEILGEEIVNLLCAFPTDDRANGQFLLNPLMQAAYGQRPDLHTLFDLSSVRDRARFHAWFLAHGVTEHNLWSTISAELDRWYREPVALAKHSQDRAPRWLILLWLSQYTEEGVDRLAEIQFVTTLWDWWQRDGITNFPAHDRWANARRPNRTGRDAAKPVRSAGADVVVVGQRVGAACWRRNQAIARIGRSVIGSGGAVRLVPSAGAIRGDRNGLGDDPTSLPDAEAEIFVLDHIETLRNLLLGAHGRTANARKIAYWNWPLSAPPAEFHDCLRLLDEIWVESDFSAFALRDVPGVMIRKLPADVHRPVLGSGSGSFRDESGSFVFLTVVGALSEIHRKNPFATIEAFRRAFPWPDSPPVKLLVQVDADGNESDAAMRALSEAVACDARIELACGYRDRQRMDERILQSNCVISLHRSVGFGRTMAEAMAAGIPVIATAFSANLEFMTPGTAALVGYDLTGIPHGAYSVRDGQYWASANIAEASWWMRRVVDDVDFRRGLGRNGQEQIAKLARQGEQVSKEGRDSSLLAGLSGSRSLSNAT